MHKSPKYIAMLCLLCLAVGGVLSGCHESTEMSKQDEQNFKGNGGKMPPEAAAMIAKQRAAAQQKMGNGGPPPQSVPGQ